MHNAFLVLDVREYNQQLLSTATVSPLAVENDWGDFDFNPEMYFDHSSLIDIVFA